MEFKPKCINNKESFISADGYYRPCCWRPTLDEEFIKEKYNLRNVSLSEAIEHSQNWLTKELSKDIVDVDSICKVHCVYNIGVEKNYE